MATRKALAALATRRSIHSGGVRSLPQAATAAARSVDLSNRAPLPLTMLTEEETMFKDSGASSN